MTTSLSDRSKCLILGSNSFAGAQFVDAALSAQMEVVGINRSDEKADFFHPHKHNANRQHYTFHQLDINLDFDEVVDVIDKFEPSYIVDFAGQGMVAQSWEHPEQWYQTNLMTKVRLHQYLKDKSWLGKYVRASTPEVYGSSDALLREDAPFHPSTPYAVSHAAVDMSLTSFFHNYHFPVVLTRFANFYGPGQQLYRIIPRTIIYALSGRKLPLHGGGQAIRAFIHGQDVATGILEVIKSGRPGEIYHFSTNDFISIRDLVAMISQALQVSFDDLVSIAPERPGKDMKYLMDSTKARQELGWEARIPLEQGIVETITWVRENLDAILQEPLDYQHKP